MPALVGSAAGGADGKSISHTLAAGNGNRIVIGVYSHRGSLQDPEPTVTYGAVNMTFLASHETVGSETQSLYMYYILEVDLPTNGANTFDATAFASGDKAACWCLCFDDLAQAGPAYTITNSLSNIGGGTSTVGADITVDTTNDLVLFGSHTEAAETFSSTTMDAQYSFPVTGGSQGLIWAYDLDPAAGTFEAGWTSTTSIGSPATVAVTFAQLSAAAGTSTILQQHG